ncbi:GGDEF domain-containing protein [Mycolicibacterium sp. P9-64]|uniref:putative bifunctional diguanylate cyclase/phosphodiesterase n=1 Tax=Mycolicibacterium sp. P9-64 TaxID=2024612 RepID=UPI0011EF89E9|nr:bifunctional diguanylate cyclase/phosphodiesterase [Mycolicibacterium sp. P9-64]KAA0084500.1 GGDEF domain-containing protein [Mycolicibacterium sp. P9-64]
MWRIGWGAGTAIAAGVLFAAWLIGGWGGYSTVRVVDDLGSVGFAVFATVCTGLAARSAHGRQRRAWICLTVGLIGWAVGEAIWAYYQLILGMKESPFPSVADVAYLVFPVGACLALLLFPVGFAGQSRTRLVLDGVIVAGALFEVSWVMLLQSTYEDGGESRFALMVSLAYPVTDIVVLTVAVLVLARARTRQCMTLSLLAAGCVLIALSDSAFVYLSAGNAYASGSLIDVGWIAALLLLSAAALASRRMVPTEEQKPQLPSRASTWLPYLPLALAAAVCTPRYLSTPSLGPVLVSSFVLMSAVMARQFVVVRDNRRLLETVAEQALRDPLTGLANRALFHDRLAHAVQLHRRERQSVAVLSLDLDHFKLVNDNLGHAAGDTLLALAAQRLLGCVRPGDTVARLGGDEFAILIEGMHDNSGFVADRVIQAFDEPFIVDGHDLLLRPSVGLAVLTAEGVDTSAEDLLKQADVAMYSAKRSRAGGLHTFTAEMHLVDSREVNGNGRSGAGAVRLLGQLRHAIDHVGLTVVYQPIYDLRDEQIVGAEALVRWPHPERGLLGPDTFLPLVRQHGLMRSVTELVLARALDDAAEWRRAGVEVPVAVNLFAPSVGDLNLPDQIMRALADRNLTSAALTIEITEDLLLQNVDRARMVLHRLREQGIRIAIDDFGSGYSALSYLRELPIDEVKLDRNFIAPILDDPRAAAVVRTVVDLAHVLGVTTVAEGIEDVETAWALRGYGCEMAQGFYYSRPVGAEELLDLVLTGMGTATSWPAPAAAISS